MDLSAFIYSYGVKRFVQGMILGAGAAIAIGFIWGGWVFGGTADSRVAAVRQEAVVRVLAPICAENFRRTPDAEARLKALQDLDSWTRAEYLMKEGYATFPGSKPSTAVAYACIDLLTK